MFISADMYTIIIEYSAYVTAGLLLVAWLKIESSFSSQKENWKEVMLLQLCSYFMVAVHDQFRAYIYRV